MVSIFKLENGRLNHSKEECSVHGHTRDITLSKTALEAKLQIYWSVTSCRLVNGYVSSKFAVYVFRSQESRNHRHFVRGSCLYVQKTSLRIYILKKQILRYSETSETICRHYVTSQISWNFNAHTRTSKLRLIRE